MTASLKIIIASEHTFERIGMRTAVALASGIEILEELSCLSLLSPCARQHSPQVIIANICWQNLSFIQQGEPFSPTAFIAFCTQFQPAFIGQLKRQGVKGFVMATASPEDLLEAIYTVSEGKEYYCPHTAQKLEEENRRRLWPRSREVALTKKELKVLELICQEFTDKEIAACMGISRRTVETHKRNIHSKTKTHNNAGCMNFVRTQGIIFLQLIYCMVDFLQDVLQSVDTAGQALV